MFTFRKWIFIDDCFIDISSFWTRWPWYSSGVPKRIFDAATPSDLQPSQSALCSPLSTRVATVLPNTVSYSTTYNRLVGDTSLNTPRWGLCFWRWCGETSVTCTRWRLAGGLSSAPEVCLVVHIGSLILLVAVCWMAVHARCGEITMAICDATTPEEHAASSNLKQRERA